VTERRTLVTTGLRESWPTSGEVILLGEWCRPFGDKVVGDEIVRCPWEEPEALDVARSASEERYESLLRDVAEALNHRHGAAHDLRFWRIVVGPWLRTFVTVVLDRHACLRVAIDEHEVDRSVVVTGLPEERPAARLGDFRREYLTGDRWNHVLCADILRFLGEVELEERPFGGTTEALGRIEAPSTGRGRRPRPRLMWSMARKAIRGYRARVIARGARRHDVVIFNTYLEPKEERRLARRFGQVPIDWPSTIRFTREPVSPRERSMRIPCRSDEAVDRLLRWLVPRHLPAAYVEDHERMVLKANDHRWPGQPKVVVTGLVHANSDLFRTWVAGRVEAGASLITCQHGGTYGMARWFSVEDHEVEVADRFLTWGWSSSSLSTLRPVGQIPQTPSRGPRLSDEKRVLLVLDATHRMTSSMDSLTQAFQFEGYLDWIERFVVALPPAVRQQLVVRCYPVDWGWDQARWCSDRLPGVQVDAGQTPMGLLMADCAVYVSTYNSTTYLQSMASGIPTMGFWDPAVWELRAEAADVLDGLHRVGVLHWSPEDAAAHLVGIWGDVDDWWGGADVEAEVARFQEKFCQRVDDIVDEIEAAIRELLDAVQVEV